MRVRACQPMHCMCNSSPSTRHRGACVCRVRRAGRSCERTGQGLNSEREVAMRDFLAHAGWGNAKLAPLPGDASTRRYLRAADRGRKAMLMDQPQGAETPACPPGASAEERRALGYNAIARLAGADCARFVAVAEYLRKRGLSAPDIYAADTRQGFVLMEDLGNDLYADVLADGGNEPELYRAAIE